MEQFDSTLSSIIDSTLGLRSKQYGYQYSEIIRSLMSIYFCGGSCIEDVTTHLFNSFSRSLEGSSKCVHKKSFISYVGYWTWNGDILKIFTPAKGSFTNIFYGCRNITWNKIIVSKCHRTDRYYRRGQLYTSNTSIFQSTMSNFIVYLLVCSAFFIYFCNVL